MIHADIGKMYAKSSKILYYGKSDVIPRIDDKLSVPDKVEFYKVVDIIFDFGVELEEHYCTIQVKELNETNMEKTKK